MEQKRLLDPDNEEVPALKDLKNRQLRLSLIVTTGMEVEVLKEWKDIDNQLYEKLVSHFNRNSTPLNIFNYYFNIPERKESQNFKEYMEDSFVVSQTRRNMILMGKTEEEIEKEVEALKKMWERKDTQFVVKMVLAPCGALSPALKIGTALSRLLNLKFMRYGNNHAALQIGPYLISWFDDSIVHIDVMSSNKALLCLYPSDKPDRCFITRALATDNLQNSTFGKICTTIARWNGTRKYDEISANCQHFFEDVFPLTNITPVWRSNYITKLFVKGVLDQVVNVKEPFTFWIRERIDNQNDVIITRKSFKTYEEFVAWCRATLRASFKELGPYEKEYYFVCHSIERCHLLREASKRIPTKIEPFFKANGEVNHIGLTTFQKKMQ